MIILAYARINSVNKCLSQQHRSLSKKSYTFNYNEKGYMVLETPDKYCIIQRRFVDHEYLTY